MTSLRSLWLRLHRWLALGLGWILILAGFTGTLLIIGQPLDRAQPLVAQHAEGLVEDQADLLELAGQLAAVGWMPFCAM